MTRSRDLADSADKDISGTLTLDDIVLSNDMTVADNGKVIFGAGSDLQIYHDGSNSYVDDAGTGRLYLRGNDRVQIQKYTGDDMITAIADGAVKLYYDNSNKLETTSYGVKISGDLDVSNSTNARLTVSDEIGEVGSGNLAFQAQNTAGSSLKPMGFRAEDIRFATGSAERVRIDSSGRLLLGTTTEGAANEAEDLTISSTGQVGITLRSTDSGGGRIYFSDGTSGTAEYAGYQIYNHSTNDMIFGVNATERMRILSGGGITFNGDTSASNALDDYEEGNCTLTWHGTSGSNTTTSSGFKYVKVGRMVNVSGNTVSTTPAASGLLELHGLPFTADRNAVGSILYRNISPSSTNQHTLVAYVGANSTKIQPYWSSQNNYDRFESSDINTSGVSDMYFSVTYMTT